MEAIGILAGGIAHDFNNLLQAMLTQAHLIDRATGDPELLAQRRLELVLLPKPFDLEALASEMQTLLRGAPIGS